jgi:hypothetical protein
MPAGDGRQAWEVSTAITSRLDQRACSAYNPTVILQLREAIKMSICEDGKKG